MESAVLQFKSETTGRKLILSYSGKLGMQYAIIGKHNFKDFGTIKEAGDFLKLYRWMESSQKIT
jgi:hypothetical protein